MKTLTCPGPARALACGAFALATLSHGVVYAQPNPFDAYDAQRRIKKSAEDAPKDVAEREPAAATEPSNEGKFGPGQWTVGGLAIVQLSAASDQQLGGGTTQDNTFFSRITPSVGYFVIERLELVGSVGALLRRSDREGAGAARSDLWVEAAAHYHVPVNARLSLTPSLGVGFYVGQSTRDFVVQTETETRAVTEQTNSNGLTAALGAAVGYQLFDSLQLQMGLQATGLIGQEYVSSEDESLDSSSLHFGLGLGARYFF